jgi:hypothetical protein
MFCLLYYEQIDQTWCSLHSYGTGIKFAGPNVWMWWVKSGEYWITQLPAVRSEQAVLRYVCSIWNRFPFLRSFYYLWKPPPPPLAPTVWLTNEPFCSRTAVAKTECRGLLKLYVTFMWYSAKCHWIHLSVDFFAYVGLNGGGGLNQWTGFVVLRAFVTYIS